MARIRIAIIEIINKAVSTVTKTESKDESIVEVLPDYSELWEVKKYKEDDFWFLKVEGAEEAAESIEHYQPISERKSEVCIVEVPSITIVIETGFGYYTYPQLVIETRMNAEIRDWSSDVSIFFVISNVAVTKNEQSKLIIVLVPLSFSIGET